MVQTLNFINLSSQQAPNDVDWAGLVNSGVQGVLIRLGHGIIRDPCASGHIAKAKQYGLYWHGYHTYEGVVNEPQFTIKNATELGLSTSQYYFVDLTKSSDPFNDYYALHATWLSQGYSTGLLISNDDYLSKFTDSEVTASGTLRWLISDTEPANYDVWQYSSEGMVGTSSAKVGLNFTKTDKLKYNLNTTLTGADINKDPYNPQTPVGGAYIGWGYDTTGLGGGKTIGYSTNGENFYALIGPNGLVVRKSDGNRIYGTIADQIDSAISANVIPAKSAADSAVAYANDAIKKSRVNSQAIDDINSAVSDAVSDAAVARSDGLRAWNAAQSNVNLIDLNYASASAAISSARTEAIAAADEAKSSASVAQAGVVAVKSDVAAVQADVTATRSDVAVAKSDIADTKTTLEQTASGLNSKISGVETSLADTTSALSDAKTALTSDVADAKKLANTAQATANSAVESAGENAKELASQANALSDAKKAIDSDVASAKGLANAAQATANNAIKSASSVANDLSVVASQAKSNANEITKVTSDVVSLQTTVADTDNALSDAKTAFSSDVMEAKNLASTAQTTADNAVKSASSVADDLTAVASQVKANTNGITKVTSDVGLLQTTVANNTGDISTIQETAKQIQQSVSDNAGNIMVAKQTADSAVAVASDAKSNATVAIQTASQASITAQNASGQAASAVITANGAMTTASDAKSNATVAVQTASGASLTATNANSDATVAKQTASEAKVQASNAESDFAQLSIRANKIEANVADNSGAIASVQQTANGLTTTVGNVDNRVKTIEDKTNWTTETGPLDMNTLTTTQNIYYRDTNLKNADGETGWAYIQVVSTGERVTQTVWHDRSSIQHTRTGAIDGSTYDWDAWNEVATNAQVVQVKNTVDGISTTINDPKTGLNATYQTAAGNATTISNVKSDVSQLSIRANKIEANVSDNSGNISKIQETAAQIQQAVSDNSGAIVVAKQTADSAVTVASDAKSNATVAVQTASGASVTAKNAQGDATTAMTTANSAVIQASDAKSNATVAVQTASEASLTAANAKGDASIAKQTASDASVQIKNAQGDISKLQTRAGAIETSVANNSGAIADVQATANQLKASVSDNAGNITIAKQTADSAVTVASDAKSNATVAIQTASQASITAQNASGQAASAVITANGAMTTASDAKSDATVAIQTASGASLTATNAQGDASIAKQTASEAKIQASNAESDFAQLSIRAGQIEASVANNSGAIASVQQTANGLTTTVGNVDNRVKKIEDNTNWTTKTGTLDMDTLTTTQNIYYRDTNLKNADGEAGWAYIQVVSVGERVTQTVWHDHSSIQHTRTGAIDGSTYDWDAWNQSATNSQVAEVKQTVDGITTTVSNIQGDVSQLKVSASSASVALSDAAGNISNLQATAKSFSAALSDTNSNVASVTATASELETKYADAANDISQIKTDAKGMTQTISNAQGDIAKLKTRADGFDAEFATANGNISKLQTDATGTTQTLANTKSDVAVLQSRADGLDTKYANAAGDINTLKANASGISQTLTNSQGDISTLKSTVSGVQTTLTDAQGNISTLQSDVSGLKKTTSDNAGNISTLQATAKTLTSQMSGAQGDISTLKQTASDFSSKVSGMETSLSDANSKINGITSNGGGRNLLQGTGTASGDVAGGNGTFAQGAFNGYDAVKTNGCWSEHYLDLKSALGRTNAKAGDWYTISVYVKADKQIDTGSLDVYRALGNVDANTNDGHLDPILMPNKPITTQWQQYSWSFQINNVSLQRQNTRVEYNFDTGDNWIYWAGWMLENGTVSHDWSPAPEDTDAKITANTTAIEQNKQAIALKADQTTVDKTNGTVQQLQSQLQVQAGQIASKVSSSDLDAKGYATQTYTQTQIKQTSDSWNANLASVKDGLTQSYTNLSATVNGLTTTVGNVDDRVKKIEDNTNWTTKTGVLDMNTLTTTQNIYYRDTNLKNADGEAGWAYIQVVSVGERVTQTVWHDHSSIQHTRTGAVYGSNSKCDWDAWNEVATNAQVTAIKQTVDGIQTQVYNSDGSSKITQLSNVVQSKVSQGDYNSQITQLQSDINLRVKSADLISQINLQAGTALIQSNKLVLDAGTTVITGEAFIPSAAISSIQADKIQIGNSQLFSDDGTLNLINQNAGTASIKLTTGNVQGSTQPVTEFANGYNISAIDISPVGTVIRPTLFFEDYPGQAKDTGYLGFSRHQTAELYFHTYDDTKELFRIACVARFNQELHVDKPIWQQGLSIASGNTIWSGSDYLAVGDHISNTYTNIMARCFSSQSTLSSKTNIEEVDPKDALDLVNQTDIRSYQYKSDVAQGKAKRYTSLIIDDVNDVSQYHAPNEFVNEERTGRDDGSAVGYLFLAVKELTRRIKTLEEKLNG